MKKNVQESHNIYGCLNWIQMETISDNPKNSTMSTNTYFECEE